MPLKHNLHLIKKQHVNVKRNGKRMVQKRNAYLEAIIDDIVGDCHCHDKPVNHENKTIKIYISHNGDDNNDGMNKREPLKTIDKALPIIDEYYANACGLIRITLQKSG